MSMKRERTRIAVLIVVAVVAIALAMLEAFANEPRSVVPGTVGEHSDSEVPARG